MLACDESRVDEELERDLTLTTLNLYIQTTLESLQTIDMESKMLKERIAYLATQPKTTQEDARVQPPKIPMTGPLLSETGKVCLLVSPKATETVCDYQTRSIAETSL